MKTNKLEQKNLASTFIYREGRLYYRASVDTDKEGNYLMINKDTAKMQPLISKQEYLKNKDCVASLMDNYKRRKCMKNCANLFIAQDLGYFYPRCYQGSLIWNEFSQYPYGENLNGELLAGCPIKCHYYKRVWSKKLSHFTIISWRFVIRCLAKLWHGYDSQPILIKSIIFLITLMLLVPNTLSGIIKIWRIFVN